MKKVFSIFSLIFLFYTQAFSLAEYSVPENFKKDDSSITLNCPWDFYWGKFISPDDFESQADFQINVPSVWNEYNLNKEAKELAKKGYGSATYRLKINNLKPETSYSFMTFALSYTAFEVYADDQLIFQNGKPCVDWKKTQPHQKLDYATFTSNKDGSKVLTFHISNNVYRKDGLKRSVVLKETRKIKEDFTRNVANYCILSGVLLAIIIYSVLLFTLKKNSANIFLALFVLTILSRIVAQIFPLIKYFFPDFSYSILFKIEFFSIFMGPAIYTLYLNSLNSQIFKHVKAIFLAIPGFIFFVLDIVLPIRIVNRIVPLMQIYLVTVILIDIVLIIINNIRHKSYISFFTLITLLIVGIGATSDILIINFVAHLHGHSLLPLSFIIYSITQISLLAYIQNKNQEKVYELNEHLKETNNAYYRFVPKEFLDFFSKKDITEVKLGEWKTQKMAILSADIRNFTGTSEKLTEIEVFDMLNSYLKKVAPIIRKYNGIIEKYLGDGLIAIFPDNSLSAIKCAIEMQEEMIDLRKDFHIKGLPDIKIGIGIHYGQLIIGTGGDANRMTEISLSEDIDIAVRTEAATKIFKKPIIVTKEALKNAADEERKASRKFDFYGERLQTMSNQILYSVYSKKSGNVL